MKSVGLLLFLLTSCTHALLPSVNRSSFLFPLGTYHHVVDVQLIKSETESAQHFHFDGVVQLKSDFIKLVALSPFNTTLFRITENRVSGKVEIENYVDSLEKYKNQFAGYYELVKIVLTQPADVASHFPIQSKAPGSDRLESQVDLKKFDESRIPREIEIENSRFKIQIKVTDYAP